MNKRFLAVLFSLFSILVFVSSAMAASELWSCYYSIAPLKNGTPDFSDARFSHLWLDVSNYETTADTTTMNLSGTFTLDGGNYSFIDDSVLKDVSGGSMTFVLKPANDMTAGENYVGYVPASDDATIRFFGKAATGGLKDVNVSWAFPSASGLDGNGTVPDFKTTEEQLADIVPSIEFTSKDNKLTGMKLRIVKSSDISTPVPQTFKTLLSIESIWSSEYTYSQLIEDEDWEKEFAANEDPQAELTFKTSIASSDLEVVTVNLYTYDGSTPPTRYGWRFFTFADPAPKLWTNHVSIASLVDGKSDYTGAEFYRLAVLPEDADRWAEAKYFVDTGTMTVPSASYTLKDDSTGDDRGSVTEAKTFKLKMSKSVGFMEDFIEYYPVDDEGRRLVFGGGAETGLNGKTITWDFPDGLSMDGEATVPAFKSTSAQLSSAVPYIELVSADGYITSVKYKLVKSSDTATAIKPSYDTDFRFYLDRTTSGYYYSAWQKNKNEGEWILTTPQALSTLRRVRARVRSYEVPTNPAVYQWNFMASSATTDPEKKTSNTLGSSSGGGCETGLGAFGLVMLAAMLAKKR